MTTRLERERQQLALKAQRLVGKSVAAVPHMHAGVDSSSVPGLRVPSGKTPGSERVLRRRLPSEMTEKSISRLTWLRHHLVQQVGSSLAVALLLSLHYAVPCFAWSYHMPCFGWSSLNAELSPAHSKNRNFNPQI